MPPAVSPLVILIAAIFTNNILLANFLGMCSFLACSTKIQTALGLGAAVSRGRRDVGGMVLLAGPRFLALVCAVGGIRVDVGNARSEAHVAMW